MNHPYVYKLTHKTTKEFYIGYREANKVASHLDIGDKYMSSSKTIQKLGFDNFDISILFECYHEDREVGSANAYDVENEMIAEYFDDTLCLNKHFRLRNGDTRFRNTEEAAEKQKITCANRSEDVSAALSANFKAIWANRTDEYKAAIGENIDRPLLIDRTKKRNYGPIRYVHRMLICQMRIN